jgi:DNA-directed RNA polymerase specialized sigma24 family protein
MVTDQRSDEDIARQAAGGDGAALRELYAGYFAHVYDYAIRISRDRDVAALVVQAGFLRVFQGLLAGQAPPSFRLTLFSYARHDLVERLRRRRGPMTEGEESFALADPAAASSDMAADLPELARIAWHAARELRIDDYELLDLSVRRGLGVEEIATVMRGRPQAIQSRLGEVQSLLEASFSGLVLFTYGRHACLDFDFMVAESQWSAGLQKRVAQHLSTCQTCQATRRRFISAAEVLGLLAFVPAPASWQQIMLNRLLEALYPDGVAPPAASAAAPAPAPTPAPGPAAALTPAPAPARAPMPAPAPVAPMPRPAAAPSYPSYPYAGQPMPLPSGAGSGVVDRFFGDGPPRGALLAVLGGGVLIIAIIVGSLCAAGAFNSGGSHATPTPTLTSTATLTRTPTLTPTPTGTSTPLPQSTATEAPTEVPTAAPTQTPVVVTATPAANPSPTLALSTATPST